MATLSNSSVMPSRAFLRRQPFAEPWLHNIKDDGIIDFTVNSEKKANSVYDRQRALTDMLMSFDVDVRLVGTNTSCIEHVIDDELFEFDKKKIG